MKRHHAAALIAEHELAVVRAAAPLLQRDWQKAHDRKLAARRALEKALGVEDEQ